MTLQKALFARLCYLSCAAFLWAFSRGRNGYEIVNQARKKHEKLQKSKTEAGTIKRVQPRAIRRTASCADERDARPHAVHVDVVCELLHLTLFIDLSPTRTKIVTEHF